MSQDAFRFDAKKLAAIIAFAEPLLAAYVARAIQKAGEAARTGDEAGSAGDA